MGNFTQEMYIQLRSVKSLEKKKETIDGLNKDGG